MIQRIKDWWNEAMIEFHLLMLMGCEGENSKRHSKAMADRIKRRSPGQVKRMEEARGLV